MQSLLRPVGAADFSVKGARAEGGEGAVARPLFVEGAKGERPQNPAGLFGSFGCGQRPLLSSDGPSGPCVRFPFFVGRASTPPAPGVSGGSGVWSRGPSCPEEGSGGGCGPVSYRRREGGLASLQGASAFSFKRAGGAEAGVRLLLWEARRGERIQRPAGPFGPLGRGQRLLLSSDGPPGPCTRSPFSAGRRSTRRPCGRDVSAPWLRRGEMGLSPRRSAQTPPRASPCALALGMPSQNALVVALYRHNIGEMTVDWVHKM